MQIASHRGKGTGKPDNTLEAFSAAVASGATILEIDLRCTRDGVIVLAHDKSLATFGKPHVWIPRSSYAELREVVGADSPVFPTFAQFYERLAHIRTILDIKWRGGVDTLRALHHFVRSSADLDLFCRNSALLLWLDEHADIARQYFPRARIVYNRIQCTRAIVGAMAGHARKTDGVSRIVSIPGRIFRYPRLAHRIVTNLRSPEDELMLYLPRRIDEARTAAELDVDIALTSDFTITLQHSDRVGSHGSETGAN